MNEIGLDADDVAILDLLRARGSLERGEVARLIGRSPATVGRALRRLRRAGFVWERTGPSGLRGRPPLIVTLRPEAGSVVGIDAGGSMLRAVRADLEGRIEARAARPARDPRDGEALIADIVALVARVAPDAVRQPLAVAAGISGIVDGRAGRVLVSPDLPGLDGIALAGELEAQLGIGVAVDNDDLLAAVGEATDGAALGCRDVAFLSFGYGLGAGLIVDGRPVRGASSAAGAIAFFGGGRLAARASGRSLPERYAEAVAAAGTPSAEGRRPGTSDARGVFERAVTGDPAATGVVEAAIDAISEAALDVAALLDPEVVVLGGGIAGVPEVFEGVERRLRAALPFPPRLVPSALEGAAVLHGAVALALALARERLSASPGRAAPLRHRSLELV